MKKLFSLLTVVLAFVLVFSGCGRTNTPKPTPSPTPDAPLYSYEDVIEVNSPIVGQWVPVGTTEQINGYMQFTSDGNIVQFSLGPNGEMNYNEVRYYLASDNSFRMIRENNSVSIEINFEVKDDGETLYIYNSSVPSQFKRIDN